MQALLKQIHQERGLSFSAYKPSFLERRFAARMRARDCADYAAYGQLLRREPEEYTQLLNALTINLTHFFRDASTFQAIEERILPALLHTRAAERRLRIWSAGCATGEEPYSIAILLAERLGPALAHWQLDILATDVEPATLEQARAGTYNDFSFKNVAPRYQPWVERYFTPAPQRQLDHKIRAMVSFQHHDLAQDPLPNNLDLILCRNVLIYFDRQQQHRLYQAFHSALLPEGFLILGKTEMLPLSWGQHFAAFDMREHIYTRVAHTLQQSPSPIAGRSL
ncbi:MAG: protein-glutamate O-methyltransferase CheR [Anaerolineae bacterium]|nr:protein-glutamate O-methyltransferase CheR [Anaerolineae bacterium]